MKKFLVFLILTLLLFAKENNLLKQLSKDIENIGQIATISKENVFYQPFIVSVFKGKDLEKLGISNLKEALELIPGVDIATDNFDNKTAVFRGSNPYAYGQSKLFIDGIEVNDVMLDSYSSFMSFPINLIKRIEVIRGPGGKLDGVNAYAGSIYVITYAEKFKFDKKNDEVFLKFGSYRYKMGGFKKYYKNNDFEIFTDFYYQRDDKYIKNGYDAANTGIYGVNKALTREDDAPLWLRNYSLGMSMKYKKFSLKERFDYYKKGMAYGSNYMYPRDEDYFKHPISYLEASYKDRFKSLYTTIKAGIKWDDFHMLTRAAYEGFVNNKLNNPNEIIVYKNGFFAEDETRQRTLYQSTFFEYKEIPKHKIKFGYIISKEETYFQMTKNTDRDDENNTQLVDYSESYPFFDEDAKRYGYILSIEDKFKYNDSISLIYGLNLENNTHIDLQINPRITLLYKKDDQNIFKFMYSRSHRSPSWQELYTKNNRSRVGNKDLKPEIVNAFEISYVKRFSIDSYFQTNLFYLINKDQINKINEDNQYRNAQDTDIYGFETEYMGMINDKTKLYLNYSFVYGKDNDGNSLPNVAKHMAKAFLIREITPEFDINFIGKYVGKKNRYYYDYREKLDDYLSFDLSLNYTNLKNKYTINFALKNIFDEDIRYPSEPYTYDDDYRQEGRHFLISFNKEF
ncbi:TonB-dependent receptor plug domain-containing protein [Nitrosophilus kaiyonis]|uniref:TonB-dependent receptor plug domain-containing protein n=1 Tax=Nitrosophilus kaiyonis TaxID=2930200 RepID=UPI0024913574|nr:TonB-dependent receptor [Nitrosophilus kaiyonis]